MGPLGVVPPGMPGRRMRNGGTLLLAAAGAACLGARGFVAPAPAERAARGPPAVGRRELGGGPGAVRPAQEPRASGEGSTLGSACRAALAALCVFASSAKARRRPSAVALRAFPSMCSRPRQKVLRRMNPYGGIPAWSRKPLMKRRLKKPWRTRTTPQLSHYGRMHMERQRVRFHYNIKNSQLETYMLRAFRKGVEYPVDNLLQQLESRLDNFVWRVGLAPTMAGARHFVREGHIQYMTGSMTEWATCNIPSCRLRVGDKVRVSMKDSSQGYGQANQEEEGEVDIPNHLEWDRDSMEGAYLAPCDWQDFGMDVDYKFLLYCYTGDRGLRRRHFRYFEGTNKIIDKHYNGGRTRPTPENILNMRRGTGLNKRGRRRPPCLWGRRRPLNNAYEVSKNI